MVDENILYSRIIASHLHNIYPIHQILASNVMYIKVVCFTASGNAPSFKIFGKRLLQLYPSLLRNNFHSVPSFAFLDVSQQAVRLAIAVRNLSYSVFLKLNIKLHYLGSLLTDQASEFGLRGYCKTLHWKNFCMLLKGDITYL